MKKELEKLPGSIYKKLTNDLYDGIYFVNKKRKIIFWNKQAEELTGYKKKEVIGKYCYDNLLQHIDKHGKKLCLSGTCPLVVSIKTGKPQAHRVYLKRKDDVRVPVDVHTKPIKYRSKIIGAVEVFRDASMYERVERQKERVQNISLLDALTHLPNRRYIDKKIRLELDRLRKHKENLYIGIVDIDHFKKINDTYGHKTGDLVLRKIAHLLDHNLKSTDFVGRYGGEEFLVTLPNTSRKNSSIALERVRSVIEGSKLIKGKVTISMGVAKTRISDNPEKIFKRADKALYKAKRTGRNRIIFA